MIVLSKMPKDEDFGRDSGGEEKKLAQSHPNWKIGSSIEQFVQVQKIGNNKSWLLSYFLSLHNASS